MGGQGGPLTTLWATCQSYIIQIKNKKKQAVRRPVPFVFATDAVTRSEFPPVRVQLGRTSSKSIEDRLDSASPGLSPIPSPHRVWTAAIGASASPVASPGLEPWTAATACRTDRQSFLNSSGDTPRPSPSFLSSRFLPIVSFANWRVFFPELLSLEL